MAFPNWSVNQIFNWTTNQILAKKFAFENSFDPAF
jgi:hypothetical protein